MKDFTRIIPKHTFEEWPLKLAKMGSLYLEVEYETVKRNLRKASTYEIDPDFYQEKIDKINKDGLIFTPITKKKKSMGYSSLLIEAQPNEPFVWYGCLTRKFQDGQIFREAVLKSDHKTVGELLGYPDCCIDYFSKSFIINPDPVWVDLEGKIKGYPECNTLLRYAGVRMTGHMSCSPICEKTRKIGKIWFSVMKSLDKNLAKELYDLLSTNIIWNSYHGVVQVETPYFICLSSSTFNYLRRPRIIEWSALKIKKPSFEKGAKRTIDKKRNKKI